MSAVRVLDTNTINKIAAGEVVERPQSVVKELVENAIDAGASHIEVEAMGGGGSFIRVTDDGCGMSAADARLAIERHATSKIRSADDLTVIGTMGFRGEALPTIASVSRFSLKTRRPGDELGTAVTIAGGGAPDVTETGCAVGTTVMVEDLFFNTPARKKFLKTPHTEGQKISEILTRLALAYPAIAFRYISNNKRVINTPGNGDLTETIRALYGNTAAEALLPLDFADPEVTVKGFVSKPSILRSSRAWQTIFVNGRIIASKALSRAIDNAYRSLIPQTGFPLAVLSLAVPPRSIDVNVHPQKTEIKFADESRMFKAVYKAIVDAIRPAGQNLTEVAAGIEHLERRYTAAPSGWGEGAATVLPFAENSPAAPVKPTTYGASGGSYQNYGGRAEKPAPADLVGFMATQAAMRQARAAALNLGGDTAAEQSFMVEDKPLAWGYDQRVTDGTAPLAGGRVPIALGQVARCYILAKDDTGLFIIDQHAAHERILFDRFSAQSEGIGAQGLLVHAIIDFPPAEAEIIEAHREKFAALGFELAAAGDGQYRLSTVPADIPTAEAESSIRAILRRLAESGDISADQIRRAVLAMTACRAAVKQGDELNVRQMQIIIDELARTSRPYTCPHGRPTIVRFDKKDLEKIFKRT